MDHSNSMLGASEVCPDLICPSNTTCVNSTHCACVEGFQSRGGRFFTDTLETCDDIDECLGPNPVNCGPDATCNNLPGSFYCTCADGYKSSSGKARFPNATENSCRDIDECLGPNPVNCGPDATCNNLPGSFNCTCADGYESSSGKARFPNASENSCRDIDECLGPNPVNCGPDATCNNLPGSFYCTCADGYKSSSGKARFPNASENSCRDIDECLGPNTVTCGPDAKCNNLPGSFYCTCADGYESSSGKATFPNASENSCRAPALNCTLLLEGLSPTDRLSLSPFCESALKKQDGATGTEMLQNVLVALEKQMNATGLQSENVEHGRHNFSTVLLTTVEKLLRMLGQTLADRSVNVTSARGTELMLRKAGNRSSEVVQLLQSKTQVNLEWNKAPGQQKEGDTLVGLLVHVGLGSMLEGATKMEAPEWDEIRLNGSRERERGQPSYRVLSPVVSVFVNDPGGQAHSLSININFSHPVPERKLFQRLLCAYWEPTKQHWSTKGCVLLESSGSRTHCQCNHLTSFAVLMAFYDLEDWRLDIITKVGLVISLLCLLLSILTFLFSRALQGPRTTIHLHLCLALFVAYAVFLTGMSRTDNEVACAVVAGLLHYFLLTAFCWMCLEGLELYLLVVRVFKPQGLKRRYMFLLGYGVPAVIVGISAASYSEGYGTMRYCWLSLKKEFIWSFLAPVCIIIAVNAVIFVVTVWKLAQKFTDISPDISKLKKFRVLTLTAIAQLCILGITWMVGMFQFSQHTLVFSYVFTILNSFQGLFIFLLHCLLKQQVRDEYRRWLCCGRLKERTKYSEFSSSMSTTRGPQQSLESGL
ncbi:adhesion G protein-coupled receptor E5 isoform X2 [Pelodiscus sinensis]